MPAATPATPAVPSTEAKAPARRYDFGSPEDFQLQQALNHLTNRPVMVSKTATERKAETEVN